MTDTKPKECIAVTTQSINCALVSGNKGNLFIQFATLAQNLMKHKDFIGYSKEFKHDIAGEMTLAMMDAHSGFDVSRGTSSFCYFTYIARRVGWKHIKKEYEYNNHMHKELLEEFGQFDHLDSHNL